MATLRKALFVAAEPVLVTPVVRKPAEFYLVTNETPVAAPEAGGVIKNIALFFAAPFIGLAYIVALPFVGFGVLAVLIVRAAIKFNAARTLRLVFKNTIALTAAPLIALAFVVFFPVIGLGLLTWTGIRAIV